MSVEEKRQELFEAWSLSQGWTKSHTMRHELWLAFNAALDAVVIQLPAEVAPTSYNSPANSWNDALRKSLAAVESTGLGLKVKA